LQAHFICKAAN